MRIVQRLEEPPQQLSKLILSDGQRSFPFRPGGGAPGKWCFYIGPGSADPEDALQTGSSENGLEMVRNIALG